MKLPLILFVITTNSEKSIIDMFVFRPDPTTIVGGSATQKIILQLLTIFSSITCMSFYF